MTVIPDTTRALIHKYLAGLHEGRGLILVAFVLLSSFFLTGSVYAGQPDVDAVPGHIAALAGEDTAVRVAAAKALLALGPDSAAAVPALVAALEDEDGDVVGWAGRALVAIGSASVPALTKALRHEDIRVRLAAAYGLVGLREKAKPALPELDDAAQGQDLRGELAA